MFHEGKQIGSYTLIKKLGKGGFGEVWLAEKRSQFVAKKVAVKLPLDEQVNLEAIRQEAELWEQASGHANVLPIIDADIIDGQVVIVSEYAEGGSLADKLKREGKFPIKQAVEMTIGVLNGLEYLHNKRIIHRDIKPANILLQGDTPRLADFGISRAMQTTIISSNIVGTDAYMSPESFRGLRTIETDIWSVGVVLYQLLNGYLPFQQENPSERMYAILQENFAPLSNEIPQNLRRIVEKSLAKLPENRYKTANEVREDLSRILLGEIILPETETVIKPKSEQPQIASAQSDVNELQSALADFTEYVESKPQKKIKPKPSSLKYFTKILIGGLFLAGISVLLIKYFENYSRINNYFSKNTLTDTPTISPTSVPANTIRNYPTPIPIPQSSQEVDTTTSEETLQQTVTIPCKGRIYNPSGNVKLRSFPGLNNNNTLMELMDGTNIQVLEVSPNRKWVHIITINNMEGWIGSAYVICQ